MMHLFTYNLATEYNTTKEQKEKNVQNLQSHIKDGILTITGLPDSIINDGDFWISDVYGKMQLVATDFIANDDSYFMEIFEKLLKNNF